MDSFMVIAYTMKMTYVKSSDKKGKVAKVYAEIEKILENKLKFMACSCKAFFSRRKMIPYFGNCLQHKEKVKTILTGSENG